MDRKTLLLRLNQKRQRKTSELIPPPAKKVVTVSDVSAWQAHQQVRQYQHKWRTEQTTLMLAECRQRLLYTFGLGSIVSAWDKVGENVDSIHNFRSGVYAIEDEQGRYASRGEYNSSPYHKHSNYKKTNAENSKKQDSGEAVDAYTGQALGKNTKAKQDHLISANYIHNDPAVWLAEANGAVLANHKTNLHQTHHSINESKLQKSTEEYIAWLNKNRTARDVKIARLEDKAKSEPLSKKVQNALEKYKQQNAVDQEKLRELDELARKQYESSLRWGYYSSAKFGAYLLKTSAVETGKMGLQQAIGLVLTDFVDGLLLEIHDSWHNGFCDGVGQEHVWEASKTRAGRVAKRCLDNWRNVLAAFRDGAISGIVSNLITTLINTFFTTARNLVRMIREGFFSLFRACKTVLMRPEGTSRAEALDAGLKIAVNGAFVIGGVLLEEYIGKTLGALFTVLPGGLIAILVAVLTGCVTGLDTVLTVYMLDRLDLFGAQHQQEDNAVLTMLQDGKAQADARLQAMLG